MKKTPLSHRTTVSKPVIAKSKKRTGSKSVTNLAKKSLRSILLSHTFHTGFRVVLFASLVAIPSYGVYAYIGKTVANEIVISKSQIIDRVAKLTSLPAGNPEAVVRVQDAENLKRQNSFYKDVESGDYIIMYKTLAVIYDLRNDKILATKNISGGLK